MRQHAFAVIFSLVTAFSSSASAQGITVNSDPPLYQVSFVRGQSIPNNDVSAVIQLPFQCATDGTVFVGFVDTVQAGSGIQPPPVFPIPHLVSVSLQGRVESFRLEKIPDLYISQEEGYFASDSEVTFLVTAAKEYKAAKKTYPIAGGKQGEFTSNAAEKRQYILSFRRDGAYQKYVEIEEPFHVRQLGAFPSGTFLVFGYDTKDHAPKLALLKADGTLLEPLQISEADFSQSVTAKDDRALRPHGFAPQFVSEGRSILIVQKDSSSPLLEVSEGGAIRHIRLKLPNGAHLQSLIPSDRNLYLTAAPPGQGRESEGTIYEARQEDGAMLRRFELSDGREPPMIACVHDQTFLSLDYGDGKIVPLSGTAQPLRGADK